MNNEKIQDGSEMQQEQKIFNPKNLENKSHDDQILHLDNAMSSLDSMSEGVNLAESELERNGVKGVMAQSSVFDKIGLGAEKLFNGKEGYDKKLAEMAKKAAEKNLDGLEKGPGNDLIALKENIKSFEKTAASDLEAVRELMTPEQFKEMEMKMNYEIGALNAEKNRKEEELQAELAEYPGKGKQEKLTSLLGEYSELESTVVTKRQDLEANMRKHGLAYNKIKGEGETSQEIKATLKEKIEILNKQYEEIKNREKIIKERVALLKNDLKELEPFVKKLNLIGKSKDEIIAENKARENKKNQDDKIAEEKRLASLYGPKMTNTNFSESLSTSSPEQKKPIIVENKPLEKETKPSEETATENDEEESQEVPAWVIGQTKEEALKEAEKREANRAELIYHRDPIVKDKKENVSSAGDQGTTVEKNESNDSSTEETQEKVNKKANPEINNGKNKKNADKITKKFGTKGSKFAAEKPGKPDTTKADAAAEEAAEKKKIAQEEKEAMNEKVKNTIKTPANWANSIKSANEDLAKLTKVNLITAFEKQFKNKKNIDGLEAVDFLAELLSKKNIIESEEQARETIENIVK